MTRAFDICCALLASVLVLAGLVGGCTSDTPNEVGLDLVTIGVDTTLAALGLRGVSQFSDIVVEDPGIPLVNHQVLYLGEQEGNRSSFLVNFDFDAVISEDYPETLFTTSKIQSVKLSLTMLDFYGEPRFRVVDGDTTEFPVPELRYNVTALTAPFDTTATPPFEFVKDGVAFIDDAVFPGKEPRLDVGEGDFLGWVAEGGVRGFIVEIEDDPAAPLTGFASRDLRLFSQLPPLAQGTIAAPNFVVNFGDNADDLLLLPPIADVSNFETADLPAGVADGMVLRTGQRRYPALLFDFSGLPANAYINRATLRVSSDTTSSFGPLTSLWAAELDSSEFATPTTTLTVDELDAATFAIAQLRSVDPFRAVTLEFNVTQYVQRRVNGVITGTPGLVLTAGEDFFYAGSLSLKPEFYFNEFHFFGTAAPDSLFPHLRITYTTSGGLGEDTP